MGRWVAHSINLALSSVIQSYGTFGINYEKFDSETVTNIS